MAAEEKNGKSENKQITDKQRFNYIGFDVFPGKPKDLFKTEAEKTRLVDKLKKKREEGDILREDCTLLEERVSMLDRMVLTVACLVILGTLFIPWYSAYNEIVEERVVEEPVASVTEMADSTAMLADSAAAMSQMGDSAMTAATEMADSTMAAAAVEGGAGDAREGVHSTTSEGGEQVLTSYQAKKKIRKEYFSLSGIGGIVSIGSVGSMLFSSGFALMLTAVLFLLYTLMAIALPLYTLYGLYGQKGDGDQVALKLKKMLRFNWIPLVLFVLALVVSFLGGSYGFDVDSVGLSSIGNGYGPGIFLGTLSYGIIISLSAFILVAVKGVEI